MATADLTSPEQPILRACAQGEVSPDDAFNQLYALYAPLVRGWLIVSVKGAEVDDLFQDVWIVFYRRWHEWRFLPEMEESGARPVASFLYRTFRFVLEGHRRRVSHIHEPLDAVESPDAYCGAKRLVQQVELGQCLDLARKICTAEEMYVLLAKLAGIPAREIARTLSVTESIVDHRLRSAVSRLQKRLKPKSLSEEQKKNV